MLLFRPRINRPDQTSSLSREAFTLLEVLASIAILAILATIITVAYPSVLSRFEAARCMNNMRQLHAGFSAYIDANGHWPQEPEDLWDKNTREYGEWWIKELQPYVGDTNVWRCSVVSRKVSSLPAQRQPVIHYTPTMFDENRQTPFKWPRQPWFIEIGNMHGNGALICFPDGSVQSLDQVLGTSSK